MYRKLSTVLILRVSTQASRNTCQKKTCKTNPQLSNRFSYVKNNWLWNLGLKIESHRKGWIRRLLLLAKVSPLGAIIFATFFKFMCQVFLSNMVPWTVFKTSYGQCSKRSIDNMWAVHETISLAFGRKSGFRGAFHYTRPRWHPCFCHGQYSSTAAKSSRWNDGKVQFLSSCRIIYLWMRCSFSSDRALGDYSLF